MRIYDIIQKKRDGRELSSDEIRTFIKMLSADQVPDYQTSALLMAIYLNGMTDQELTTLTMSMADSGGRLDLTGINDVTLDKHSTGGVGDKTTLIVAPTVAACGGKIAKMSGRGLGFTGGTIDKLEAFPGFKTVIPNADLINQVNKIGIGIVGQSGNLAPADKKIYALRDVTATVESIPLIASSIMSKKLAAGSDSIVLDVKTGSGAMMKSYDDSKRLAKAMVKIGQNAGKKVTAVLSSMQVPLGNAVGNILEVKEAIDVLTGKGPEDTSKLCGTLSALMLMSSRDEPFEKCLDAVMSAIESGKALEKFRQMICAQGGDSTYIDNPEKFATAKYQNEILSEQDGYIAEMNTEKIGISSCVSGAGREEVSSRIDMSAGLLVFAKTGDRVKKGDIIAKVFSNDKEKLIRASGIYASAISYSHTEPVKPALIYEIIK